MNRREFLAAGLGTLSLAGKFPPSRPVFTVEMEVEKCAIWVNGKNPDKAWIHDEGFGSLNLEAKNLIVGGVTINSIKATMTDCGCYPEVGNEIIMETSKGTFRGKVTHLVDPNPDPDGKPVSVELYNKETLKITEGQRFFRIYFNGGR